MTRLGDSHVREALQDAVMAAHQGEPDTLVLHEVGISHGTTRVDMVVLNGHMHGYEIKSDRDTLRRLPKQVERFSRVLDFATIVVGQRHLEKVEEHVPSWWGITVATGEPGEVTLTERRAASPNPATDPLATTRLLWRDEALQMLEALGEARGVRGKARRQVYERLMECKRGEALREAVREQLKARYRCGDWTLTGSAI